MKTKTYFAFRIDAWDGAGNEIVEHLAGLDDHSMAVAAYAGIRAPPFFVRPAKLWPILWPTRSNFGLSIDRSGRI